MVVLWRRVRATTAVAAARWRVQRRYVNKGYRQQPPVPAYLKEALSCFGVDAHNDAHNADGDPIHVPEERRHSLLRSVTADPTHLRSHNKLDRLRIALDAAAGRSAAHASWRDVYLYLRTTELSCELTPRPDDVWPKGHKLWVELELCEEQRLPMLQRLPNGMLVLPVFSMEQYMDFYFSRAGVFESCWLPTPRAGPQWEVFCQQPFPVGATGLLPHFAALATVALRVPQLQVALLLNPGQSSSKFLTFPELTQLARLHRAYEQRQQRQQHTPPSPSSPARATSARHTAAATAAGDGAPTDALLEPVDVLDDNLVVAFDTRKMPITRVDPTTLLAHYAAAAAAAQQAATTTTHSSSSSSGSDTSACEPPPAPRHRAVIVPPMARLELHLLLHRYEAITHVFVRTLPTARWRRTLLGAKTHVTHIDVVVDDAAVTASTSAADALSHTFVSRVQQWSYLAEFQSDIHIALTSTPPLSAAASSATACDNNDGNDDNDATAAAMTHAPLCVYTAADGAMLRRMAVHKAATVADRVGYDEPIVDEHGGKPFETYANYYR